MSYWRPTSQRHHFQFPTHSAMRALVLLCSILTVCDASITAARPNVLYILSDDMRADVHAYGLPVLTPNLDALSAQSLRFEHAYSQISVCSPSRQSFLTGLRPDTNKVWNFIDANPLNSSAIPGHFRDHGYLTLGLGKTFHEDGGMWNANRYWSTDIKPYFPYTCNTCPNATEAGGHCVEKDHAIYDWNLLQASLDYLEFAAANYKNTTQPFFLMTGFRDPHAPWAAPKRMYDLYKEVDIKVARHKVLGPDIPLIAWSNQLQVRLSNGTQFPYGPYNPVPDWVQQDQRHAYYAAVSYVDEHVGALLSVLEQQSVAENTIVVFHSDHGYHLGEHGEWEKKSNFDMVIRVPMIIKVPGVTDVPGFPRSTASIMELVDIFPTLSELCSLQAPQGVDGISQAVLFKYPNLEIRATAYHQYPACGVASVNQQRLECNQVPRQAFDFMGYSVRTYEWRYTAWLRWNKTSLSAIWGERPDAEELYPHLGDNSSNFDDWENANWAKAHPRITHTLYEQLRIFFSYN